MRGPKRTVARFRGIERRFATSKAAYIFLIDSFIQAQPDLLDIDWQNRFASEGAHARKYFGRDPKQLFEVSPHLAEDANNYARIAKGWFAIMNLSNAEKFQILCRLAALGKWQYEQDWSWEIVEAGTRRSPLSDL